MRPRRAPLMGSPDVRVRRLLRSPRRVPLGREDHEDALVRNPKSCGVSRESSTRDGRPPGRDRGNSSPAPQPRTRSSAGSARASEPVEGRTVGGAGTTHRDRAPPGRLAHDTGAASGAQALVVRRPAFPHRFRRSPSRSTTAPTGPTWRRLASRRPWPRRRSPRVLPGALRRHHATTTLPASRFDLKNQRVYESVSHMLRNEGLSGSEASAPPRPRGAPAPGPRDLGSRKAPSRTRVSDATSRS